MKSAKKINTVLPMIGIGLILVAIVILIIDSRLEKSFIVSPEWMKVNKTENKSNVKPTPTIEITPTIAPTATPTPITVEGMNQLYGPCVKVNVLMYHHIQDETIAKERNQTNLNVSPEMFKKQMQYLKDNNYNVVEVGRLKSFFENGTSLPTKPVIITVDDGYKDNYEKMYPILKEFGYRATVFTATGLLNNPDYMAWDDMSQMKDLVYFGNHTWSHQSSGGTKDKLTNEISLAARQLSEHGFDDQKIFAYPYGNPSAAAKEVLKNNGYEIAFTTVHGNILCKGKSLELPRIRIGNAPLKSFGL